MMGTPNSRGGKRQGKGKKNTTQRQRIFAALQQYPMTRLMVAHFTGIERADVCRRVAELRKSNSIAVTRMGLCKITKHRAEYLTTDRELFNLKTARDGK